VPHNTAAKIADKVRGVAPRLRSSDSADIVPDGNANERSDTEAVFNYLLRKTRTPRKWGTWFQLLPMAHICGRPIVIRQVQKRTGPNAEVARIPLVENVNVFFPKGVDDITRERVLSAAGPFDNDVIVFANDGSHFWPTVPINNPSCSDDEKQCLEQLGVQLLSQPVWTTNPLSALSDTCYNSPSDDDVRAYWQELRDIQGEARAQSLRKRHNVTTSLNQLRGLGDSPCSYGLLHGAATILGQPIVVVNQASRLDADGCFQFDSKCLYTPQNWTVKDVDRFQTSPFKVVDDFHVLLQHGNLWCGTTNYSGPPDIDADGLKFTKTGKLPLGVWFLLLLLLPFVLLLPPLSVSPPVRIAAPALMPETKYLTWSVVGKYMARVNNRWFEVCTSSLRLFKDSVVLDAEAHPDKECCVSVAAPLLWDHVPHDAKVDGVRARQLPCVDAGCCTIHGTSQKSAVRDDRGIINLLCDHEDCTTNKFAIAPFEYQIRSRLAMLSHLGFGAQNST